MYDDGSPEDRVVALQAGLVVGDGHLGHPLLPHHDVAQVPHVPGLGVGARAHLLPRPCMSVALRVEMPSSSSAAVSQRFLGQTAVTIG